MRNQVGVSLAVFMLAGCGGGSDSGSNGPVVLPPTTSPPGPAPAPTPAPVSDCTASVAANNELSCDLDTTITGDVEWTLTGAPEGMVVQSATGQLRWTPLLAQTGTFEVEATVTQGNMTDNEKFTVTVTPGTGDAAGIYVSSEGDDSAAGTATAPFKTLQQAADNVSAGETIYLRGGEYRNDGFGTDFNARSTSNIMSVRGTSGTANNRITVRPHGNEYVKLISDVGGLRLRDANYWTIEGLEMVGSIPSLDFDTVMDNWWVEEGAKISGRGISNRDSDHLVIKDCIIHNFPAAGISNNGAEFLNIENNIVYNNAWWSTGGTHGITSSSMKSTAGNADTETVFISGNLAFGNQSIMISHVFSKGFVTLDIDEGNSIHLQNNDVTFSGRVRVEDNLLLFSGKSGLGLNTIDKVNIRNNSFYLNGAAVNTGAISLQSSKPFALENNLFHPRSDRVTIKDFGGNYTNIGDNATTGTAQDGSDYPSIRRVSAVFAAPENNDFNPVSGLANMGVSAANIMRMFARAAEYGITIEAPEEVVNEAYINRIKQIIFDKWPVAFNNIELRDRATRLNYSYAQRCHYPGPPTDTVC